jgi:hypothetical protein
MGELPLLNLVEFLLDIREANASGNIPNNL